MLADCQFAQNVAGGIGSLVLLATFRSNVGVRFRSSVLGTTRFTSAVAGLLLGLIATGWRSVSELGACGGGGHGRQAGPKMRVGRVLLFLAHGLQDGFGVFGGDAEEDAVGTGGLAAALFPVA